MSYDQHPYQQHPYPQDTAVASLPMPAPHSASDKPGRPARRRLWPWLASGAAALVVAGGLGVAYFQNWILKDSGIAACEAMRDQNRAFDGKKLDGEKLTEQKYREMRAVFEDSRYEDIRDHGTKLMDVVWQLTQLPKDAGFGALPYFGQLAEHSTGLQSACADQGIILPNLVKN